MPLLTGTAHASLECFHALRWSSTAFSSVFFFAAHINLRRQFSSFFCTLKRLYNISSLILTLLIHFHVHNFFIHSMKFDRIKLNFQREVFPYEYVDIRFTFRITRWWWCYWCVFNAPYMCDCRLWIEILNFISFMRCDLIWLVKVIGLWGKCWENANFMIFQQRASLKWMICKN